jgi:hypothetical protein
MEILEVIIKLIPLLGIFTIVKAIWEYRNSQNWKRSEFLAKEMKSFLDDERIKPVLRLLDYNKCKIKLSTGDVVINDVDLINALQTHNLKSHFTTTELEIRELFDYFFDKLNTYNIWIKSGLISEVELYLYLGYYIDILTSTKSKPEPLIGTFDKYLKYYQFIGVNELFEEMKKFKSL